jgi:hypothetical protein
MAKDPRGLGQRSPASRTRKANVRFKQAILGTVSAGLSRTRRNSAATARWASKSLGMHARPLLRRVARTSDAKRWECHGSSITCCTNGPCGHSSNGERCHARCHVLRLQVKCWWKFKVVQVAFCDRSMSNIKFKRTR